MRLLHGGFLTLQPDCLRLIDPHLEHKTQYTNGVSATQHAFRTIRKLIITGEIAPGERLKVESLKATLNIGAPPIREALSLLTSDQLVERIDQRGFRAAPANAAHFSEILTLRCQLEPMALEKSLANGDHYWEERLVLAHHRLSRASRNDTEEFENLHRDFHMAVIAACDSPILIRFCLQLYDLNVRYRYLAGRSSGYENRDIASEHSLLTQAAINRDIKQARSHLVSHYEKTGQFLAALLPN